MTQLKELQDLLDHWNMQSRNHSCEFLRLAERAEADGRKDIATHLAKSAGALDLTAQGLLELLDEIENLRPVRVPGQFHRHSVQCNRQDPALGEPCSVTAL